MLGFFLRYETTQALGLRGWRRRKKEVMTEQVAQIQLLAAQPACTTGSALYEIATRNKLNGYAGVFEDSSCVSPEKKILEDVYISACRGRWIPKDKVDFDMLKTWLRICENFHGDQCQPQITQESSLLGFPSRVIDVRRGSVAKAPLGCRYVCLSYVWGNIKQLVLNNQTMSGLSRECGIYEIYSDKDGLGVRISKTIEDAIYTTRLLGEQYLWVDALCVKQDETPVIKQNEINQMDLIYGGAVLTIVAAAGNSAIAGLPGVHEDSRTVNQHMEVIKDRQLITSPCPAWERGKDAAGRYYAMESTTHVVQKQAHIANVITARLPEKPAHSGGPSGAGNKERALSRRLLIFREGQVYFQCRQTVFYEDTVSDIPTKHIKITAFPKAEHPSANTHFEDADDRRKGLGYYQRMVEFFTRRKVSFADDALNACEGLLSQYRKLSDMDDSRFSFGLPLANFTHALCWTSLPHSPGSRRKEFPTWSWAGWSAFASYLDRDSQVDIRSSMVQPAIADESYDGRVSSYMCPQALQDFDPLSQILKFEALVYKLRVSRSHDFSEYAPAYSLTSPEDPEHCVGAVYLDEAWRASRPDDMDFIVLGFMFHDHGQWKQPQYSYGVRFLCIEWVGDIAYRVQLSHEPPMNERPFWTPPGEGRQSIESVLRIRPQPQDRTLIRLGWKNP
ncbi:MAG: hypothetical protein M1830_002039 [Pleopsidium flavum]|nr:MAG: hypothetical protein M1830_002039 [Pleopsidium flavum]